MSKWQRYKYLPVLPLGEGGRIVTGSDEHIRLSRQAAAEGMVLLKNEGNILPLKKGSRVALLGKASADYVKGGGGSGDVTTAYVRNLCDGMEEKANEGKIEIFPALHEFYRNNVSNQRASGRMPGYTAEPELPRELFEQAKEFCDTAVISICRFSIENADRKGEKDDGDFYLSPGEKKLIDEASEAFSKIVLVLNVGGVVDSSYFANNPKIGAVLLAWQGGMEGAMAIADILTGGVNPSGKLTDTFAASFDDYPSSAGFNESDDYVCYTDDIFVGYRYFETVPGAAQRVNYPFGFGLSYTDFSFENIKCDIGEKTVSVRLCVKNTGAVAGKETVQLYVSSPTCRLEMPKIELRAFKKTGLIEPGQAEAVELSFAISDLAAYDEAMASYVLFGGAYGIYIGNSVRNLTKAGEFINETERVTERLQNRCVPKKLPKRMKADGSFEPLPMGEYAARYSTASWPRKAEREAEHILQDMTGLEKTPEGRLNFEDVAEGKITLDEFMEGLTDDELITLTGGTPSRGITDTKGIGGLDYIGIPAVMTADGPAGLRVVPNRGVNTTAWPVATLLACTWDEELIYRVGEAAASEVKENNIGMWLTPAINIHRSPLCGRNFEYYSEDPLVAGKLAAAMTRGIQSLGVSACVKHFCCNNKETNRYGSDSRVSERALREIYLKAFRIVVEEGKVWAVMTSYNYLNGTFTSENSDLITGILRGEWQFSGLVLTDWINQAEHYREILAGNNLRMPYGTPMRLKKARSLGLITRADLESSARRVLEFLLRVE